MNKTLRTTLLGLTALVLVSGADGQTKKPRIGCLTKNASNPYFLVMIEGCKAAAKKYNVDIVIGSTPTEGAEAEQLGILETWLNQGNFDGFVVTPFRATSLNTALAKASAKGLPIVNIDELVPLSAAKASNINISQQISSDNVLAGTVVARQMLSLIPKGSQVAVLEGAAGVVSSLDRVGGFTRAAKAGGLQIVTSQPADWDRAKAFNVASNILQSNPDVKGFFAANDGMALGALQAVRAAGKNIPVFGVDATPEALASVQAGALAGTVQQHPDNMALQAVGALVKVIGGGKVPAQIKTSVTLVTKANVASIKK